MSPPDGPTWQSGEPLTATQVLDKLAALGCHSTDITDALYGADANWPVAHNAEARAQRRRMGDNG